MNQSVSVSVVCAGLCGSDLHRLEHGQSIESLGHELVVEYNGDLYALNPLVPCNTCARCAEGKGNLCPNMHGYGKNLPGGFGNKTLDVQQKHLYKIPFIRHADYEKFVLTDGLACVMHAVKLMESHQIGRNIQRVAVVGSGTIAILTCMELAKKYSVTLVVKTASYQVPLTATLLDVISFEHFLEEKNFDHFDAIFECVGGNDAGIMNAILGAVKPGGIVIGLGVSYTFKDSSFDIASLLRKEVVCIGSNSFLVTQDNDEFGNAFQAICQDEAIIPFSALITHRFAFSDLAAGLHAHANKRETHAIKVVFINSSDL